MNSCATGLAPRHRRILHGGWVAEVVTATAGSSSWFDRGFITYSDDAKRELLGVDPAVLRNSGAVSEATVRGNGHRSARALLRRGRSCHFGHRFGPSGGSEENPSARFASPGARDSPAQAATQRFTGDREAVRRQNRDPRAQDPGAYLRLRLCRSPHAKSVP